MKKNLKQKIVIIIGVLVVFLYGAFFGFDAPRFGGGQPLINQLTQHIHLGLDLQGGVHCSDPPGPGERGCQHRDG